MLEDIILRTKKIMKPLIKGAKNLIITATALTILNSFNEVRAMDQTIHVQGSGYNVPFNNNPIANVDVFYKGELVGNTETNNDGSYNLTILLTKNQEAKAQFQDLSAYPNPYTNNTNVDFSSSGSTSISVYDIKGSLILQQNYELNGSYTLNLEGLGQGIRLVNIRSNNDSRTLKVIQQQKDYDPKMEIQKKSFEPVFKNVELDSLTFEFTSTGHDLYIVKEKPESSMVVDYVLQQYSETGIITKNTLTNDLIFEEGIPDVFVQYMDQDSTLLTEGNTNNQGLFEGSFSREYWVNWENNEDTIFNISPIKIKTNHSNYMDQEMNAFNDETTVLMSLEQITQNKNTSITTTTQNDIFEYMIQNANVSYINPNNNLILTQGVTNAQGIFNGSFVHEFYINPANNDTLFLMPNVQIDVNAPYHDSISNIVPNQDQTINYVLMQIPENKSANVSGNVINTSNQPLNNVLVSALNPDVVTINTTNTNISGDYNFMLNYVLWENYSNPGTGFTEPEFFKLKFEKPMYQTFVTNNKNFLPSVVHNQVLSLENQTYVFKIHPFTATNEQVSNVTNQPFAFHLKTVSDNVTHTFFQSGNNPVDFTITGSYFPNEVVKLWHNNPEAKFDQTLVLEHPNQVWTVPNIAQNSPVRNWFPGMPMDTLTTTLSNLTNPSYANIMEAYFPEQNLHSTIPNIYLPFSGDTIMTMWANRGATPSNTVKNWKYDSVPHVDRVIFTYRVITGDPWNNSNPITPAQLQAINTVAQGIDQHLVSASSRVRMPVIYNYVNNQADAQEFIDRGWDYVTQSYYQLGTPTNGVLLDPQNYRIKYSNASFPPNSVQGDIYEEHHEALFAFGNGPNNMPSKQYTAMAINGDVVPNPVGQTMIYMASMLDPFTPVLVWNQKSASFEPDTTDLRKKYNVSTTNISNDYFIDAKNLENKYYIWNIEDNNNIIYEYKE